MANLEHAQLYADNRARVRNILERTGWKARDKQIALWNFFLSCETKDGTQFLVTEPDHDLWVVLGLTHEAILLPAHGRGGMPFFAYLHARYGISEREKHTTFLYDTLRLYIWQHGNHVELRRFAVYDRQTRAVYLSGYDGRAWRLDGETIVQTANGEDNVFFCDDDGGIPCKPEIGNHGLLLPMLTEPNFAPTSPGGMTPRQQQQALTVWMFALAFPDLMPTKPLLILEGAAGSGKSSTATFIQLALIGAKKPIILQASREDDFGITLLRAPICVLDNLDKKIEWLTDAVCAYATSGQWTHRKLYTNNEEVTIRPHSFLAVTSRNPASFRRDDAADRSIVLRFERRKTFVRQARIEERILSERDRLFGEYLYWVNKIVAEIRGGALDEDVEELNRMADFATMARIVGRVLAWPEDEVRDLLRALQAERDAFINEGDSLADILAKWIIYRPKGGPSNIGREVPLNTLYLELETIAEANSLPYYRDAQTLLQRLQSAHLERDFVIQRLYIGGHHSVKIWRRSDARLATVG